MRRALTMLVALAALAAAAVNAQQAEATAPAGCHALTGPVDPLTFAGLDLTNSWVDTFEGSGAAQLRATLEVRSLPAAPPEGASASIWTFDARNELTAYHGLTSHPYLQVVQDATGAFTGSYGSVISGRRVIHGPATVEVVAGSPGYISVYRDTDSLSIPEGNYLTNATALTEAVFAQVYSYDRLGPSSEVYIVGRSVHSCVDFALAAQPTAKRAADFVDSVGVNTHLDYGGFQDNGLRTGTYMQLENALLDVGIRHIRETYSATEAVRVELTRMGTRGIKVLPVFNAAQGQNPATNPTPQQAVEYVASMGTAVDSVEGQNEPIDLATAQAFQKGLYAAVKADPRTAHLPVGTPAINPSNPATYDQIGDLSPWGDWGSLHAYSFTEPYSRRLYLDGMMAKQRKVSGTLPMWVTESGWDSFASGWYRGVVDAPEVDYCYTCSSERAQAAYVPKMLLTNFAAGVVRSYIYELIDEAHLSAPTAEDYFGLIRADFSPKPVYHRLKTLNRLLADPGTVALPGSLTHTVSPSTMQHLLLQKSDGSFWLALWKDDRLYAAEPAGDTGAVPHDVYPEPTVATVSLGKGLAASEYSLASGPTPVRFRPKATTHTVSVPADDVVLLRLA